MTFSDIVSLAETHGKDYEKLTLLVKEAQDELDSLRRQFAKRISAAIATAANSKNAVLTAIEKNGALFESPKTYIIGNLKIGLRKGRGALNWDDDEALIEGLEKMFPGKKSAPFIKTTKKVIAKGLKDLSAEELASLGVTLEDTSDIPTCEPVAGKIQKIVNAILKDCTEEG